jgi:hypothetical protein
MTETPTTRASSGRGREEPVGRRLFIRGAGTGALGIGLAAVAPGLVGSASAKPVHPRSAAAATRPARGDDIVDSGAGMYTGMSVAEQMSSATINPAEVSCGVGTVGLDASDVEKLIPVLGGLAQNLPVTGGSTGPFAMLMYSITVASYQLDRSAGMITATGRMRSITRIADQTIEDAKHHYMAIAKDGRGTKKPHFAIHFKTPFWSPANPIATPSDAEDGLVMFGGNFLVGTVNVSR